MDGDTITPLWTTLFWLALGVLVLVLIERLPRRPADDTAEARKSFDERLARETSGRDC